MIRLYNLEDMKGLLVTDVNVTSDNKIIMKFNSKYIVLSVSNDYDKSDCHVICYKENISYHDMLLGKLITVQEYEALA